MSAHRYSAENIRKGIVHYLFGRVIAGIAGFGSVLLLVRFMNLENYAAYTAISGVVALSGIVGGLGIERAVARYVPEGLIQAGGKGLSQFIWLTALMRMIATLLIVLLLYVAWQPVTQMLNYVELRHFPIALAVFLIAENLFGHFSSVFQSLMLQKMLTRLLCIQWGGRFLLIISMVIQHGVIDLEQALWASAIPEFLGVLAFSFYLIHHLSAMVEQSSVMGQVAGNKSKDMWPPWKPVMQMAMHNYASCLLASPPETYSMRILIAATLPVEIVAAYGFFVSLAEKIKQYIPLHFFYNMIEPVMIARYLQDKSFTQLSERCHTLFKFNLIIFIPAIAWIVAAGPEVIDVLTGGKFQDQTWILLVVMLQLLIGSHGILLQLILNALGLSKGLVRASIYGLAITVFYVIACMVFYIPGVIAAPIAFAVVTNAVVIIELNRQGYAYQPAWQIVGMMSITGLLPWAVVAFAISLIPNVHSLPIAIGSGFIVLIIYAALSYFFSLVDHQDIKFVSGVFKKKLSATPTGLAAK